VLSVSDDGVGMPSDFSFAHSTSLGLSLVYTLVDQLDGALDIERDNGTMFRVHFAMEERQ
jgi:two-component sensor histidine kinase